MGRGRMKNTAQGSSNKGSQESKIVSPAMPEEISNPGGTHKARSDTGYSSDVRAGLGSVDLDPVAASPTVTRKGVDKSPPKV